MEVTTTTRSQIVMSLKTITYAQHHVIMRKMVIVKMTMNHLLLIHLLKYRLTFVLPSLWATVII